MESGFDAGIFSLEVAQFYGVGVRGRQDSGTYKHG